jgi:hypothetical protein
MKRRQTSSAACSSARAPGRRRSPAPRHPVELHLGPTGDEDVADEAPPRARRARSPRGARGLCRPTWLGMLRDPHARLRPPVPLARSPAEPAFRAWRTGWRSPPSSGGQGPLAQGEDVGGRGRWPVRPPPGRDRRACRPTSGWACSARRRRGDSLDESGREPPGRLRWAAADAMRSADRTPEPARWCVIAALALAGCSAPPNASSTVVIPAHGGPGPEITVPRNAEPDRERAHVVKPTSQERALEAIRAGVRAEGLEPAPARTEELALGGPIEIDVGVQGRRFGIAYITEAVARQLGTSIPQPNARGERLILVRAGVNADTTVLLVYAVNYPGYGGPSPSISSSASSGIDGHGRASASSGTMARRRRRRLRELRDGHGRRGAVVHALDLVEGLRELGLVAAVVVDLVLRELRDGHGRRRRRRPCPRSRRGPRARRRSRPPRAPGRARAPPAPSSMPSISSRASGSSSSSSASSLPSARRRRCAGSWLRIS